MVVAMRTTRRTIRLVLHQSTIPVWGLWDSYLRLSYLYFRCCTRLCDVITMFVVNTTMMVFNLWLMCVTDLWAHISLCIQFRPWNWVWQATPKKNIKTYHIIYLVCRYMWSLTKPDFIFYDFLQFTMFF